MRPEARHQQSPGGAHRPYQRLRRPCPRLLEGGLTRMAAHSIPAHRVETAVASADILGETPLWCDRTRKLWWLDIDGRLHQSFDPATGAHQVVPYACNFLCSQALTADGSHLLALDLSLHRRPSDGGALDQLCEVEHGPVNRLNDGRVDARGRLWIG